jgi:hypothetical protein
LDHGRRVVREMTARIADAAVGTVLHNDVLPLLPHP